MRQENRQTTRIIKNISNHHFDGDAHNGGAGENELFQNILDDLSKTGRPWCEDDVLAALAEVERLHIKLGEIGRMSHGQVDNANEVNFRLLSMFIEYLDGE